jgi:hypothetical protein
MAGANKHHAERFFFLTGTRWWREAPNMEEHLLEDLRYPHWQVSYRNALVELDHDKLMERVSQAESAILDRLQTLPPSGESLMERQAIADALANLRCLKRETLGFLDCQ